MAGMAGICCPNPSSRSIPILCSKYSPVQPKAFLLTQPSWGNIIIGRLLVTDTLNQMSNYSHVLKIPLDSKPQQKHFLMW